MRAASRTLRPQCFSTQDTRDVPNRLAQQDMQIIRLSKSLDSLQDRMLALEKSMVEVRMGLRANSWNGFETEEQELTGHCDALLGAIRDAEEAEKAAAKLRAENEHLKQKLYSIEASSADKVVVDPFVTAVWRVAPNSSTGAPEPAQKKRKRAKRKPAANQNSAAAAAAALEGPESSFISPTELDEASQIGGLAALEQITAAMSQTYSPSPDRVMDKPVYQQLDLQAGAELSCDQPEVDQAFPNVGHATVAPGKQSTSTEMTDDGGAQREHAPKTAFTNAKDPALPGSQFNQPLEESPLGLGPCIVPWTEPQPEPQQFSATQAPNAAAPFQIATTIAMIDPAPHPTSLPVIPNNPPFGVLSSIENLPDLRQTAPLLPLPPPPPRQDDSGKPRYDSVHESRIRDHKARDALRKRQQRARKLEKKQMEKDKQFKEEEKIRIRDRMVKELMERAETLESEGDL